jgi:heme exporter protein C
LRQLDRLLSILTGISLLALAWLIFNYAPQEEVMGEIQRIFYVHAPAGMASLLLFMISGVLAAIFIFKRDAALDRAGRACIETGFVFASLVLVTGPVWAKQAWGAWWTGEPRLTTFLILWLIYAGYLVFRAASHSARAPLTGAIIALLAGVDLPLIYLAPHWWNRNHPDPVKMSYHPEIRRVFLAGIAVTLLLALTLTRLAYRRMTLEESHAK